MYLTHHLSYHVGWNYTHVKVVTSMTISEELIPPGLIPPGLILKLQQNKPPHVHVLSYLIIDIKIIKVI